jgi:UPF0755 protein
MAGVARRIIKIFAVVLGCFAVMMSLFTTLAVGGYLYFNASPLTSTVLIEDTILSEETGETLHENEIVSFEVYKGESAMSVGRRLEDAGIIKSRYFWYILSRLNKGLIKTGIYQLELPATQVQIHEILVSGKQMLTKVTVPEGVTLTKIAAILAEAEICEAADFLAAASDREMLDTYRILGETMEGFLYPDTYLFPHTYPALLVVKSMADTFFQRLTELDVQALDMTPEALYQRVIIASIVEREYRVHEEAALMAGVFYNRLAINMPLQSCATVEYVITEILGKPHPAVLSTKDTEIPSPYNTYMQRGLPPGPISAPGAIALHAAFNPVSSDYLYFRLVNNAEGRHYFSKTFDEHIQAGLLYVKGNQKIPRNL